MERKKNVYNPKNIVHLVIIFCVIFWLLYNLASFLHESKKINNEIESIRQQNEKNLLEIEDKKRRLSYLQTDERIDKEAKMQMGKKQEGEQVIVFIEEKIDIIPTKTEQRSRSQIDKEEIPVIDKWKWIFWGNK